MPDTIKDIVKVLQLKVSSPQASVFITSVDEPWTHAAGDVCRSEESKLISEQIAVVPCCYAVTENTEHVKTLTVWMNEVNSCNVFFKENNIIYWPHSHLVSSLFDLKCHSTHFTQSSVYLSWLAVVECN